MVGCGGGGEDMERRGKPEKYLDATVMGYHSFIMKMLIDIPEDTMRETIRFAAAPNEQEAVLTAMEEFNRNHRQAEMTKFLGTFVDFITPEELANSRNGTI